MIPLPKHVYTFLTSCNSLCIRIQCGSWIAFHVHMFYSLEVGKFSLSQSCSLLFSVQFLWDN